MALCRKAQVRIAYVAVLGLSAGSKELAKSWSLTNVPVTACRAEVEEQPAGLDTSLSVPAQLFYSPAHWVCWQTSFLIGMFSVYSRATWSCSRCCYCDVWNPGGLFKCSEWGELAQWSQAQTQRVWAGRAPTWGLCCPWSISSSWRSHPVEFKPCCLPSHLLYLAEVGKALHSQDNVIPSIRRADWKKSLKHAQHEIIAEANLIVLHTLLWRSLKYRSLEWFFSVMISDLIWWWPCAAPGWTWSKGIHIH